MMSEVRIIPNHAVRERERRMHNEARSMKESMNTFPRADFPCGENIKNEAAVYSPRALIFENQI
jgi:hypothetical protein